MKQTRQSQKKSRSSKDGVRTAVIAAVASLVVGALSSGVTYWTTQSSLHQDEVIHQQDALRSACLDSLKVQEGEVVILGNILDDLTILKNLSKFQGDIKQLDNMGSSGQASELYLVAPKSVQNETTRYVNIVDNYAIPDVMRLAGIPSAFRDKSPEANQAVTAINQAQASIAKVGFACRAALS